MGRMALFDREGVAERLASQHGLITRDQASGLGVTEAVLRYRIRPGGPWRTLLPGVYLAQAGPATTQQRDMAAMLCAGPGSAITGPSALAWHGIRVARPSSVDVLVPAAGRRRDISFVRLSRTAPMPGVLFPLPAR
jgi:predicted transcriptional regulator of viral defense system